MSTPTETATCTGYAIDVTDVESGERVHCPGCAALAALQVENAELRERNANLQTAKEHFVAKSATLRERLEAAERALERPENWPIQALKESNALHSRATAAEGERDRLRGLLERAVVELRGVEVFSLERFIPANSVHRVVVDASAALAAIPHTEGEASAPPKETTP
jgi:cell division septum initiation protein DivIVA